MAKKGKQRSPLYSDTMIIGFMLVFIVGALWNKVQEGIEMPSISINANPLLLGLLLLCTAVFLGLGFRLLYFRLQRVTKRQKTFKPFFDADLYGLHTMDPFEFEAFIAHMFEQQGYRVRVTIPTKDGGIDLFIKRKREHCAVQVKRYHPESTVGVQFVREFYGSIAGQGYARGILITTAQFSSEAQEFAQRRPLELVPGNTLMRYVFKSRELPWYRALWSRALAIPDRAPWKRSMKGAWKGAWKKS